MRTIASVRLIVVVHPDRIYTFSANSDRGRLLNNPIVSIDHTCRNDRGIQAPSKNAPPRGETIDRSPGDYSSIVITPSIEWV